MVQNQDKSRVPGISLHVITGQKRNELNNPKLADKLFSRRGVMSWLPLGKIRSQRHQNGKKINKFILVIFFRINYLASILLQLKVLNFSFLFYNNKILYTHYLKGQFLLIK